MIGGKSNQQSDFVPCPEGQHAAVCVDIIQLGKVKTSFEGKEKEQEMFQFVFEAHPLGEDKTYLVFQRYGKSLHPKSNFRKALKGWRGRDLNPEEEQYGYEEDLLLHKPCLLMVSHNQGNDGNTYANIDLIRPLKGQTCTPAGTYARAQKYGPWYPHSIQERIDRAAANHKPTQEMPLAAPATTARPTQRTVPPAPNTPKPSPAQENNAVEMDF